MLAGLIETIIFDWGNTLMQVNPANPGKMKDWDEVAAIDGAKSLLAHVSQRFNVVLATNARDSTIEDVEEALVRVSLDKYINRIFLSSSMHTEKSNPDFYRRICAALDLPANRCLMVGDDYQNDILPANLAGLFTVWLNPKHSLATAQLPLHDLEISGLRELEDSLSENLLPSYQQCLFWYLQHGATNTLWAHVNVVASASYQVSSWFAQQGISISPLVAHRGGLLHDLAKLRELPGENHAVSAARLLNQYGQPVLAQIALRHLIGKIGDSSERPLTWEEKIVNYCDKLTEGSQLVSLDQRLEALQTRYPEFAGKIRQNTPLVKALENEITRVLGLSSTDFLTKLRTALYHIVQTN